MLTPPSSSLILNVKAYLQKACLQTALPHQPRSSLGTFSSHGLACLTFFPNAFEPAKYQQQPQMSRVPASSDFRAIKFKGRQHHNWYSLALPRHSTTWAAPPAQYSLFWCWIFFSCLSRTCFLVPSLLHYHKWKNKCQECLGEYKAAVREAWLIV
jgi:hypothetical protein